MTKEKAFRISYYSLGFSFLVVLGLPIGCAITSIDNSGWDYLSDDINFLSVSTLLVAVLLLISLSTGAYSFTKYRVTAFWVIPLSIFFLAGAGMALFGLYIDVFNPFG